MIFLIVQAVLDKRFRRSWRSILAFTLVASVWIVVGLAINWQAFLRDNLEYGSRISQFNTLLDTLIRSHYANQLSSPLYFNIWSTLGFILLFYILARNKPSDRLCSIWAGAIFTAFVVYGNAWWAFLVIIYPLYSLAIANVLHDILYRKENSYILAIFVLFLTLPIFTQSKWYPTLPPSAGKLLLIVTLLFAFGILLIKQPQWERSRIFKKFLGSQSILHSLMVVPLIAIILTSAILDFVPVFTVNDTRDQQATVEWLNDHTTQNDIVAAASPIVFGLRQAEGIRYEYTVLYTTKQKFLISNLTCCLGLSKIAPSGKWITSWSIPLSNSPGQARRPGALGSTSAIW